MFGFGDVLNLGLRLGVPVWVALLDRGTVAAISRETLRRILRAAGITWQTTTTWKASPDPDFIAKMQRIPPLSSFQILCASASCCCSVRAGSATTCGSLPRGT